VGERVALLIALCAAAGFVWWLSRPVQGGTRINAVAGLRG
jgi:hypothetical protein